jgi:hypothetical protein
MRKLITVIALAAMASPLAGQAKQQEMDKDPTMNAKGTGQLPSGWQMRLDDNALKRGAKPEDVKFVTMGPGYHFTSGPAAVYYNSKDMLKGNYVVKATFTQTKAPMHPEAYGLFSGGSNLQDSTEQYLYFIVRGDGKYMINHRAATTVHKIVDWTENPAIKQQDADGKATNALEIRAAGDSVHFVANGTEVKAMAKADMHGFNTDGYAGVRVNHNLDIHLSGFEAKKM